jgi:UDP-N-acetylglucosamine acyltransferase
LSEKAMSDRTIAVAEVHATAVLDPTAELGADVVIGPYCVIGPNVVIRDGTRLGANVVIERDTVIGPGCAVHSGAVLGGDPQDLKYRGEPSRLEVGARTVVREFVTLNRGTSARGLTEIGSDCLIMAYAHVAHDCRIGDHVVIANAVNMGGHVEVDDWAIVGGLTAIHQFARVGRHAFVGGASAVRKDVPPYVKASGSPLKLYGLNAVGLQRRGFGLETRTALRRAYRVLFQSGLNLSQAVAAVRLEIEPLPEVLALLDFIERSERGIAI